VDSHTLAFHGRRQLERAAIPDVLQLLGVAQPDARKRALGAEGDDDLGIEIGSNRNACIAVVEGQRAMRKSLVLFAKVSSKPSLQFSARFPLSFAVFLALDSGGVFSFSELAA
jgi:hypothetical protein